MNRSMEFPKCTGYPFLGEKKGGFTLFELLVVMVIIGFMAAMVAPRMGNSLVNLKLKTVTREVSASLRYARSRAVAERKTYFANFDPEKRQLTISPVEGSGEKPGAADEGQDGIRREVYAFPKGLKLDRVVGEGKKHGEGPFDIAFFPNGSSSGGAVLLTNDRKRRYRISVDFITGLVHVDKQQNNT